MIPTPGTQVICRNVGPYSGALTRGKSYEVLEINGEKLKICGDNSRHRWYSSYYFNLDGTPAPTITRWEFEDDEAAFDPLNSAEDVDFWLSDGTKRWCTFTTPSYLSSLLTGQRDWPGYWSPQTIIVNKIDRGTVTTALNHLCNHDLLTSASRAIEKDREPPS